VPPQRVEAQVHPLSDARAHQESSDLKSKLSQIIYQGLIDRLKYGPVHADDLEGLFPEESRSMCRRLVGAQFGSLASRGYIVERERRKSKVPSRKGAKSGVFEFTKKGRETLVGGGVAIGSSPGRVAGDTSSGEKSASGVAEPQGPRGSDAPPAPVADGSEGGVPGSSSSEPPARLFGDPLPSAYDPYSEAA
jgi:hypothetical protein